MRTTEAVGTPAESKFSISTSAFTGCRTSREEARIDCIPAAFSNSNGITQSFDMEILSGLTNLGIIGITQHDNLPDLDGIA
jgi:hypothetical protein